MASVNKRSTNMTRQTVAPAGRKAVLIGVASGIGARDRGCADGPGYLRRNAVLADLDRPGGSLVWAPAMIEARAGGTASELAAVAGVAGRLARRVRSTVEDGTLPVVIGGDHSIAIGTWSGVHAAMAAGQRLGLLWIDAHLDSHTFATTPSRAIHGMPLACLLGYGDPLLTGLHGSTATLLAEDVCVIGARSFEAEEGVLLDGLGVRIYFMPEIHRRGVAAVLAEAVARVTTHADRYGVSFDLDAFDPGEEEGTGTPVADGLFKAETLAALSVVGGDPRLAAVEIVEYNPHRDPGARAATAIHDLCRVLTGR
jgi:arginase